MPRRRATESESARRGDRLAYRGRSLLAPIVAGCPVARDRVARRIFGRPVALSIVHPGIHRPAVGTELSPRIPMTMDLQALVQALSAKAIRWYAERPRRYGSEVLSADASRLRRPDSPMVLGKRAPRWGPRALSPFLPIAPPSRIVVGRSYVFRVRTRFYVVLHGDRDRSMRLYWLHMASQRSDFT